MFRAIRPSCRIALAGLCLSLAGAGWAAEPAGRVLVAVGEVSALRGGQTVPLRYGATIEVGDQIRTGAASNAQIRFNDSAIVSIKPQTDFAVAEFVFNGSEDGSERAVFNLLRGGFRTVTGLIGHINKKNYEVRTPTSTIGIRGTVWGAHHCVADECRNGDGSHARPGTYGEVKAGAVAVGNNAPETVFGANTAFYVADINTPATRLLYAPDFVIDQLQGRTRNAGKSGTETGAVNIANTSNGSITPLVSVPAPLIFAAADNRTASGASAALGGLTNVSGFIDIYTVGVNGFDGVDSCNPGGGGGCNSNQPTTWTFNGNQLVSYGGSATGTSALTQGGTAANVQTMDLGANGQVIIGQLTGSYAGVTSSGTPFSGPGGFLFGATNSSLVNVGSTLPASGSFVFGSAGNFIGLAVDSAGNTAATTSFSGTYNAGTRTVAFAGSANFSAISAFGSANFTFGGSGVIGASSDSLKAATLTWACTGTGGCEGVSGSGAWDARFLHSATNIPLQVINGGLLSATKNATSGNSVVFIGALKCISGGC